MIDLSGMKRVEVDPEKRTGRAERGATWGDFGRATQALGLASTGGIVPSTGVGGLTLGGGDVLRASGAPVGARARRHGHVSAGPGQEVPSLLPRAG